jgi:hypothetical protein
MTKGGTGKIGFGEQTADTVCNDVIHNPFIENEFQRWIALCRRAGIGMQEWLDALDSSPGPAQELTIPAAENYFGVDTLTNIQAKQIADAIFYWQMNSEAIEEQFALEYGSPPDPNVLVKWATMLADNFNRPDDLPPSRYPRVHALLKNKVYTCNSTNGSSIISTNSDVSFTKTDGTTLTLNAGDPCQFGSEFSEFTFRNRGLRSLCGPNNIFCESLQNKELNQCYNSCNCDNWPNPYKDLYSHITHARYADPDGTFRIKDGTRDDNLKRAMNNPDRGDYKVCTGTDYEGSIPRDSATSNCQPDCNCNYTCALVQAGARYAGCYPDEYSPLPVRGQVPGGEPWPPYCTQESHCTEDSSCDLGRFSCVPSGPYCSEQLRQTICYWGGRDFGDCESCLSTQTRATVPAHCPSEIKDAYCSGGH